MFIYALIDPRTALVRYVGKTADPSHRVVAHASEARRRVRDTTRRANWIRSLLKLGLKPQLEILETVEGNGDAEERFYIALFRALGADLVNATAGGDGVEFTAEIRAKMAQASTGRHPSDETRLKLRAAKLGYSHPGVGVKIGAANRGRKLGPGITPAGRAKIAASNRARVK